MGHILQVQYIRRLYRRSQLGTDASDITRPPKVACKCGTLPLDLAGSQKGAHKYLKVFSDTYCCLAVTSNNKTYIYAVRKSAHKLFGIPRIYLDSERSDCGKKVVEFGQRQVRK
jgi:hypothetical protein